jgi:mediator of RNA polymerase II transcription subunit 5
LGAKRLLGSILEEVKAQTAAGNGSIVIDVATAIICAPDVDTTSSTTNPQLIGMLDASLTPQPLQRRLTLRDALITEADNAPKAHKGDVLHLEAVMRLCRRVEHMMTVAMAQASILNPELGLEAVNGGMNTGVGMGIGDAVLSGQQDLDDALQAANQGMMDDFGVGGIMGVGEDDFLLGIS